MTPSTAMTPSTLHVVRYQEGDAFAAQCLEVDVASDGETEEAARANIKEALALYFDDPFPGVITTSVGAAHVEELNLKSA